MLPRQNLVEKKQILRERYLLEREISLFLINGLDEEAMLSSKRYIQAEENEKNQFIKN